VIAVDDERSDSEKITRISQLRPDIILMSGGVDGGSVQYLAAIAELVSQANPQPRFGSGIKLPIVYAGNVDAQDLMQNVLGEQFDIHQVENLRPTHDIENLGPARENIHNLFMEHVMAQAPGYDQLGEWVDTPIMPTPGAVGRIISIMADKYKQNIVGVDIGGATTDVFSSIDGHFTRTVSANLGMSYSVTNVLESAGVDNIRRWIPFHLDEEALDDWISNKMVRPTTVPQTLDMLIVEQAIAREALKLSFEHHKSLAKKIEKETVQSWKTETKMFMSTGQELIDLMRLDILVGSGGVLSHAPRRAQAALMMLDAFLPEGVTQLTVDSIFMMPHLGVLSTVYPEIAAEVFDKDCLIRIGTAIAPVGKGKDGQKVMSVKVKYADGRDVSVDGVYGAISTIPLEVGQSASVEITPDRGFDVGAGRGKKHAVTVNGGLCGIILDCRGRQPFELPKDDQLRVKKLLEWFKALDCYPQAILDGYLKEYSGQPTGKTQDEGGKKNGGIFGRLSNRK
jgi:uncharacterized protein (TIGR01319 family)